MDGTGSSPLPVDHTNTPLAYTPEFSENLNAQCWLWKDHTSIPEAGAITETAAKLRPQYLAKIGGTYSSEWFWAKIWHCLNTDSAVFGYATYKQGWCYYNLSRHDKAASKFKEVVMLLLAVVPRGPLKPML